MQQVKMRQTPATAASESTGLIQRHTRQKKINCTSSLASEEALPSTIICATELERSPNKAACQVLCTALIDSWSWLFFEVNSSVCLQIQLQDTAAVTCAFSLPSVKPVNPKSVQPSCYAILSSLTNTILDSRLPVSSFHLQCSKQCIVSCVVVSV